MFKCPAGFTNTQYTPIACMCCCFDWVGWLTVFAGGLSTCSVCIFAQLEQTVTSGIPLHMHSIIACHLPVTVVGAVGSTVLMVSVSVLLFLCAWCYPTIPCVLERMDTPWRRKSQHSHALLECLQYN